MTGQDTLDALARRAAADLRAAAVASSDGADAASVGERHRTRRFNRLVVAGTAVIVALLATGVVLLRAGDETVVADGGLGGLDPAVMHLVPTDLPKGHELSRLSEAVVGTDGTPSWAQLWGRAGTTEVELSIAVEPMSQPGMVDSMSGQYERVAVGSYDGVLVDDPRTGGISLLFEPEGLLVSLRSRSLSAAELEAIGGGMTFADGSPAAQVDPTVMPAGFEVLATFDELANDGSGVASRPGATVVASFWNGPSNMVGVVIVSDADREVEWFNRFALAGDGGPLTVRGIDGWQSDDGSVVVWRERPDVLIVVTVYDNIDPVSDLARTVAEGLAPAEDETWTDLLARGEDVEETTATTSAVAVEEDGLGVPVGGFRIEGQRPDGRATAVYINADGLLCAAVAMDDTGAYWSQCDEPSQPGVLYDGGEPILVYGRAPAGVAEVRASVGNMALSSQIADADGDRLWVLDLELAGIEEAPTEVVEHDAAGNELRRIEVSPTRILDD